MLNREPKMRGPFSGHKTFFCPHTPPTDQPPPPGHTEHNPVSTDKMRARDGRGVGTSRIVPLVTCDSLSHEYAFLRSCLFVPRR